MKRALALGLVLVVAASVAGFAQELSGKWTLSAMLDTLAGNIQDYLDYTSSLTLTYTVDSWDFTSVSTINDSGWTDQSFSAGGPWSVFEIDSGLDISTAGVFEKFDATVSFPFASLDVALDFELKDKDVKLVVDLDGATKTVTLDLAITFGENDDDICDLNWSGIDIDVDFPFNCADIDASLEVTCAGFQKACLGVSGISVPNLPWVKLGAKLCFYVQTEAATKQLTLTPVLDFGEDICFDIYIEQAKDGGVGPYSALVLGGFTIGGIGLTFPIGDVTFTGQSYWGTGSKPSLLSGTEYWEAYQLKTSDEACCGPIEFSVSVFFDKNSTDLFDLAGISAFFSYNLGDNLKVTFAHDFSKIAPGVDLWTIGFEITW